MNLVLVHGFLNRGGILASLAAHLTSAGHCCFTPSLKPCDARGGLEALARELKSYIHTTLPENSRFAIVGFSMGALISRYYLQELGGRERVAAYFSIGGPHAGTVNAYLYPSKGARQMRPRSEFLAQMDRTTDRLSGIPITCYWSPFDLMIRPLSSARWPIAQQVRIPSLVHSLLVFDRRLHQDIERRLAEI
ncbi:MAG: alpha/beta fold hydrolase [Verrucomicrobia bacterium]|nr:MAG: alpha/beta fold hydrolase [Verrucomicrobiota bacterium]